METPYPWWLPGALSASEVTFLVAAPPGGDEHLADPFTVEDVASTHLEWDNWDDDRDDY